jgi:ABC-2 type transport system permease protein
VKLVNHILIKREFLHIVWNKKFIFLTFAFPFLIAGYLAFLLGFGTLISYFVPADELKVYGIYNESEELKTSLNPKRRYHFSSLQGLREAEETDVLQSLSGIYIQPYSSKDTAQAALVDESIYALVITPELFLESAETQFWSRKSTGRSSSSRSRSSDIQNMLQGLLLEHTVTSHRIRTAIERGIPFEFLEIDTDGNAEPVSEETKSIARIIADFLEKNSKYLFIGLMLITTMQSASRFAVSMARERESKLLDLLLSSVNAEELVIAKSVAIVAACLLRLFIWLACVAICIKAFLWIQQVEVHIDIPAINFVMAFLLTLLGMLFYGLFITSTSTGTPNPEDALSRTSIIKIAAVLLGYFFAFLFLPRASYQAWSIASLFPFLTPFLIPLRLTDPTYSLVEGAFFIVYMLFAVVLTARLAGRALRLSLLTEGQHIPILEKLRMLFGSETKAF